MLISIITINYNNAVGSLESRFIPSAKKMKELGGSSFKDEVGDLKSIELSVRPLNDSEVKV